MFASVSKVHTIARHKPEGKPVTAAQATIGSHALKVLGAERATQEKSLLVKTPNCAFHRRPFARFQQNNETGDSYSYGVCIAARSPSTRRKITRATSPVFDVGNAWLILVAEIPPHKYLSDGTMFIGE
eukprot:TRINITY_DN32191_c0_g1_i1.p2 TRINITY_DN32191_c0_g1~~TRINITY_DN32191_c0_g1_i1.p2  ORF type:complete len:128 (-),score=9.18 TRINITY_DN32191_c0_g1_i1:45-428(-)